MTALKIERMGEHVGVTLPQEVVEKLGLAADGVLFVTGVEGGELRLSTRNPETERQVALGLQIMRDYDATFRALAR